MASKDAPARPPDAGDRAESPRLTRTVRAALEWYSHGEDWQLGNWSKRPSRAMRHRLYADGWISGGTITDAGRRVLEKGERSDERVRSW